MKRFIALPAIALALVSAPASADNFSFSYHSGGYQPYRTYHYVAPQTLYLAPYGPQTVYVERRVVRPYYYPVYKNKWHDRREWKGRHDNRRGDWHRGRDNRHRHR